MSAAMSEPSTITGTTPDAKAHVHATLGRCVAALRGGLLVLFAPEPHAVGAHTRLGATRWRRNRQ